MTEIKICGITNKEDALYAAACGADALGFIFYTCSPRAITPEDAKAVICELPENIVKVGVFVNHEQQEVKEIFHFCGLDFIQLHGDESAEYCRNFVPSLLIKAASPRDNEELEGVVAYPVKAILVDARDGGLYGGTGKKANWAYAAALRRSCPLILSGGLNESNILEAISQVAPDAVDINSGIESLPGKKDRIKLKNIIRLIRNFGTNNETRKIFSKY